MQEGFRSYDCFAGVAGACAKLIAGSPHPGDSGARQRAVSAAGWATARPSSGCEDEPQIEKTVFSAVRADGFDLAGREQALVCGIEAHVCVSQTVHDLLDSGVEVHVPADAVGSRHELDYRCGLERMDSAGAVVSTVEAALFELLERAGTPEFKAIQKLII